MTRRFAPLEAIRCYSRRNSSSPV